MWKLIQMEIKKVSLKPHIFGLLAANFIIFLLSVLTSSLLTASGNISTLPGFSSFQLDTVTIAAMLVKATLIVWEAVLISVFVIEEYRNKTIGLLFTYPVSRKKLIMAKLFLICSISCLFHVLSNIFQYASIFLAAKCFDFVTFRVGNILVHIVTTISAVLLGMLPLYVGMIKKSTIATVVSSIVIVAIASNSQGSSAGLLSIPVAAIIFGIIGIIFSVIAMKKMILSDLSN